MTLTDWGQSVIPPLLRPGGIGIPADAVDHTLNDASDAVGYIFPAAATANIIGASFTTRAVATTESLTIELWSVDATSGKPSAIITTMTVDENSVSANTEYDVTFGTTYAATMGEVLALVIRSKTGWVTGDIDISQVGQGMCEAPGGRPYRSTSTDGGTNWTNNEGEFSMVGIEYASNRWYTHCGFFPASDIGLTLSMDGTPTEAGLKFTPTCDCRVVGVVATVELDNDATIEWYTTENPGAGTTVLSIDKDERPTAAAEPGFYRFTTAQECVAGTSYRVTFERASGTNKIHYCTLTAHQKKEAFGVPYAQRTGWLLCQESGGSWDDTTHALSMPILALVIDQFHDDDAGGGGGGGGMRLVGPGGLVTT